MLTVMQLIQLVIKAEEVKEKSWCESDPCKPRYRKSNEECLTEVFAGLPDLIKWNEVEYEMARFLLENAWNEVQDWNHVRINLGK